MVKKDSIYIRELFEMLGEYGCGVREVAQFVGIENRIKSNSLKAK
jgi:hypothetical protein